MDHATGTTPSLTLAYRALFVDQDDGPEDRRVWNDATAAEQKRAANLVHSTHGGTVPVWAR